MKKIKKYLYIQIFLIILIFQSYILSMKQPYQAYILSSKLSQSLTQQEEELIVTEQVLSKYEEENFEQYQVLNALGQSRVIIASSFQELCDNPKIFLKSTTRRENDTMMQVESHHPLYKPILTELLNQQKASKTSSKSVPTIIYTNSRQLYQGIENGDDMNNAQINCVVS